MDTVEIRGILLTRVGGYIIVEAWMPDGSYREVIRERAEGPISHCVHAGGIRKAVNEGAMFSYPICTEG